MQPTVTFRHMEPNDALKKYAAEKVSRIEKYVNTISEVHMVLSVEKRNYIAEVIVNADRTTVAAKDEHTENMYTAIDFVMDKIERQLKKHKDKITSHKDQHRKAGTDLFEEKDTDIENQPDITYERVPAETMTIEDALQLFETSNSRYVFFTNIETGTVNIVCRTEEGRTEIVQPDLD